MFVRATGNFCFVELTRPSHNVEEAIVEKSTKDNGYQLGANVERPDSDAVQPNPEKSADKSVAEAAARDATRRYVERVDRYLARPDVMSPGRNAAPSSAA
jgi:hypothetical protein